MAKFEVQPKVKRRPKSLNISDNANVLLIELSRAYNCGQSQALETLLETYAPSLIREANQK